MSEDIASANGEADDSSEESKFSPSSAKANLKKLCAVCGDKALGYNFNALTCESCKAFFRRNALKPKQFKCPFTDNCEVTKVTRRFCQKCRLRKCFDIGMKKEWILSDAEKQQKRQKIEENRAKKRAQTIPEQPVSSSSPPVPPATPGGSNAALFGNVDFPSGESFLERPQARVLPSSRNSLDDASKPKVPRYEASQPPAEPLGPLAAAAASVAAGASGPIQQLLAAAAAPSNALIESQLQQQPALASLEATNGAPSSSLIKQELGSASPDMALASNSSGNGTLVDMSNFRQDNPLNLGLGQGPDSFRRASNSDLFAPPTSSCGMGQQRPLDNAPAAPMVIPDFSQINIDNLDDIVAVAIEAEFHATNVSQGGGTCVSPGPGGPVALNDAERARLNELFVASRALLEPLDLERPQLSSSEPNNLISVINLTDLAIKRIIRMTKKITPFIRMCQEDQIALLKGGVTELMILRSVINYNPEKNAWRLPSKDRPRELSLELLKEASQLGVNLYEEHQRFVQRFNARWRTDEYVMLLLSAIALFTPTRSNVLHKEVVKMEQDSYYYLLRRYLETVCTGCDSRLSYLHLIERMQDLHRLNESHIQLFLEVNPKHVEPLLIEIFDLNPTGQRGAAASAGDQQPGPSNPSAVAAAAAAAAAATTTSTETSPGSHEHDFGSNQI